MANKVKVWRDLEEEWELHQWDMMPDVEDLSVYWELQAQAQQERRDEYLKWNKFFESKETQRDLMKRLGRHQSE